MYNHNSYENAILELWHNRVFHISLLQKHIIIRTSIPPPPYSCYHHGNNIATSPKVTRLWHFTRQANYLKEWTNHSPRVQEVESFRHCNSRATFRLVARQDTFSFWETGNSIHKMLMKLNDNVIVIFHVTSD